MNKRSAHHKGIIGEGKIALRGIELGFEVLKPMNPHGVVDLVFHKNNKYYKVQCKYVSKRNSSNCYRLPFVSVQRKRNGKLKKKPYPTREIDIIAAYLKEDDTVIFVKNGLNHGAESISITSGKYKGRKKINNYLEFPLE